MGLGDKLQNKAQEAAGKVQEKTGELTDNEKLQAKGLGNQAEAKTKQAGEHIKDAAKDVTGQ